MPQRVAGLDLAVARLVDVPLSDRQVAILGDTALRCAAPKLVDVLALRATHGQLLADDIAEQLDSSGRWPATSLDQPAAALALACQWAVGGERVRNQARARTAFADILATVGPAPFAEVGRSAQLAAQLAWLAGDLEEVRRLRSLLPLRAQDAADLDIDLANPWATHQPPEAPVVDTWSQLFNRRLAAAGLAPVAVDLAATLPFDGLYAATGPGVDGPLVTVIVPSYAPDAGLINSIRSLAAQTYGNLEILLVDDASGPAYSARYDEALALDPRVRLLRMPVNGGSYVGRNEALASARGRFITTQDADDWSHPDRVADQVGVLLANPLAPASRSDAIRALDDLSLQWLGHDSVRRNASSLMVRRSAVEIVGGFDIVRKAGDSEFRERVERRLGPTIDTLTPLAITRLRRGSLSRSDFRLLWQSPDRVHYQAAYRAFHQVMRPGRQVSFAPTRRRPFPAPRSYQSDVPSEAMLPQRYDVVYLVDLSQPNPLTGPAAPALLPTNLRISLVHQEDPTTTPRRRPKILPTAMAPVLAGQVDLLSVTDRVSCTLLVALTPACWRCPARTRRKCVRQRCGRAAVDAPWRRRSPGPDRRGPGPLRRPRRVPRS